MGVGTSGRRRGRRDVVIGVGTSIWASQRREIGSGMTTCPSIPRQGCLKFSWASARFRGRRHGRRRGLRHVNMGVCILSWASDSHLDGHGVVGKICPHHKENLR